MKRDSSPITFLPEGIPTYRARHGRFVWPATLGPTTLLHDDFDLLWVQAGRAAFDLPDGQRLYGAPGDMLLLPPFVRLTIDQAQPQLIFWYCHFDFRASPPRGGEPPAITLKIPKAKAAGIAKAYAALNEVDTSSPNVTWRREAALIAMIVEIARTGRPRSTAAAGVRAVVDPRVIALRQRIEADPAAVWRVTALAREVDLSPSHLHALWVAGLGCSLKTYLVRARLRRAISNLRDTTSGRRQSIKEIAIACGFSSQHLLSRQFQQAFGITPTAFRESAGL